LLKQIVRTHLARIPFENITKLYNLKVAGFKSIPSLSQFLDGIEHNHFGGTCYTLNYHLNQLLRYLGYNVELCGADMSQPDVHVVNHVIVDGREFIVDVGYAAPFLVPLPQDLPDDFKLSLGSDEYIISPRDERGRSQITLYRNGVCRHGYLVNPVPRRIEEFENVVSDSFRSEATFMNCVLLVRFGNGSSQMIHNLTYMESKGKEIRKRALKSTDELIEIIEKVFTIPKDISRIALDGLSISQEAW